MLSIADITSLSCCTAALAVCEQACRLPKTQQNRKGHPTALSRSAFLPACYSHMFRWDPPCGGRSTSGSGCGRDCEWGPRHRRRSATSASWPWQSARPGWGSSWGRRPPGSPPPSSPRAGRTSPPARNDKVHKYSKIASLFHYLEIFPICFYVSNSFLSDSTSKMQKKTSYTFSCLAGRK